MKGTFTQKSTYSNTLNSNLKQPWKVKPKAYIADEIDEEENDDVKSADDQPNSYYIELLLEYYKPTQYRREGDNENTPQALFNQSLTSHLCWLCNLSFDSKNQLH